MNAPDVHLLVLTDDLALAERIQDLLEPAEQPAFRCSHAPLAAIRHPDFTPADFDVCLLDASHPSPETRQQIDHLLGCAFELPLVMLTERSNLRSELAILAQGVAGCVPLQELTAETLTRQLCHAMARYASEQRWRKMATHDDLTELPRRAVFMEHLESAIARADRTGDRLALLYLDLDGFKAINDSQGHTTGDALLKETANRLKQALRKGDIVARIGGDEFVVLQQPLAEDAQAEWLARRLEKCVTAPVNVEGKALQVGLSIGIARYPEDGTQAESLIQAADQAMYDMKRQRHSGAAPEKASAQPEQTRSLSVRQLTLAIEKGEFELVFQPILDTRNQRVMALEAFVRWRQPGQVDLLAAQFLPQIENRGLSQTLGAWIMREALIWQSRWAGKGFDDISVAINLSALEIDPSHLLPTLQALLRPRQTPENVWLEVNSSLLSSSRPDAFEALRQATEVGMTVVLDNIGGGDSCIETLTRLKAAILKVDRAVVQRMREQVIYKVLAQSTYSLCQSLSLLPIASGVENESQQSLLEELGFTRMQGNHFCPAQTGYAMMEWLERHHSQSGLMSTA